MPHFSPPRIQDSQPDQASHHSLDNSSYGQIPIQRRQLLARRLAARFLSRKLKIDQESRDHMAELLARLFHDIEYEIRLRLARNLARRRDVPRNLLLALAHDEITIAHDILIHSPLLDDEDLIEIVRLRSLSHRLAITLRRRISSSVSVALIEPLEEPVIRHLLTNQGSHLDRACWTRIIDLARSAHSLHEPILGREDLEAEMAKKLFSWVSEALTQRLLERFPEIRAEVLREALTASNTETKSQDASQSKNPSSLPMTPIHLEEDHLAQEGPIRPRQAAYLLAQRLKARDAINSRLLAATLKRGDVILFEALLASRLDIPEHLASQLIHDHIDAMPLILQSIDAKRSEAAMILALLDSHGSRETLKKRLFLLDHAGRMDKDTLDKQIHLLITDMEQDRRYSK